MYGERGIEREKGSEDDRGGCQYKRKKSTSNNNDERTNKHKKKNTGGGSNKRERNTWLYSVYFFIYFVHLERHFKILLEYDNILRAAVSNFSWNSPQNNNINTYKQPSERAVLNTAWTKIYPTQCILSLFQWILHCTYFCYFIEYWKS